MNFTDEEVLIVKRLIDMWGWEWGDLSSEEIVPLAKKLQMDTFVRQYG